MKSTIKIGRDSTNDVIINEPGVSRSHAIIHFLGEDNYELKDLQSSNGTFVNDEKVTKINIKPGDRVRVANSRVDWMGAFSTTSNSSIEEAINEEPHAAIKKTIAIGLGPEEDIVLTSSFVSAHQAKISVLANGEYFLEDSGSSNGSFINGRRIEAKNFLRTDIVKLADTELPKDWFKHSKLKYGFIRDHRKSLAWSFALLLVAGTGVLSYINRCAWFGMDCLLSSQEIYAENNSALVRIEHAYFYELSFGGQHYFVGKNKYFTEQTEANTSTQNLLPYTSVSGNGSFVRADGTILTAPSITNPWLNAGEQQKMLQEVIKSRTVRSLALGNANMVSGICGKTAELKWIANGQVANAQNYVQAVSKSGCNTSDTTVGFIQSVKGTLPTGAKIIRIATEPTTRGSVADTGIKYFGGFVSLAANDVVRDTFYAIPGITYVDGSPLSNQVAPAQFLESGSPILNKRGELIGIMDRAQTISIQRFFHHITR